MDFEYIIIGAGVVGLACSMELSKKSKSILLLERHPQIGMDISSRNSEVIHAGIYYPQNSLKALLCVDGNKSLYDWCNKYNIPHKQIGKFIVSVNEQEDEELLNILNRAHNNGAKEVMEFDLNKFKSLEPNIKTSKALFSPKTGIIDSHKLMESFKFIAEENEVNFAFNHKVEAIEKLSNGYKVVCQSQEEIFEVSTEKVINASGLYSDKIASMLGIDIIKEKYNLHFVKGNYFRLKSSKKNLANHLIYPVPPKNNAGLGVHITLDLNGEIKFGPDVEYLGSKVENYDVNLNLQSKFFESISLYLNNVELEDIYPDQSGIRPKLQAKGEPFRDFIINEESSKGFSGFVNLLGIESPGLTCSLEIAKLVSSYF